MIERLLAAEAALIRGELEHAERLFASVAEADARNAIALVGLARVASRRGRTDQARDLVHRALAIDPDEAAARRLLVGLDADAAPIPVTAAPVSPVSAGSTPVDDEGPAEPAVVDAAPGKRRPGRRPSLLDRLLRLLGFRRGG